MTTYSTSDIILAATLIVKGEKLSDLTMDGYRGTFHFQDPNPELIKSFELGEVLVEPISFHDTIKRLSKSIRRLSPV